MSETWRLFIAVELPEPIRAALAAVQQHLQHDRPPVAWTRPEALHLTVQFLGETQPSRTAPIGTALRQVLAEQPAFDLHLGTPGAFPNMRRPGVLWVGLAGATGALEQMQARVAAALEPLGFPREARPFHPHLTLGRVHRDATAAQCAQIGATLQAALPPPPLSWRVERIVLFQSELRRDGPRYHARDAVVFAGDDGAQSA